MRQYIPKVSDRDFLRVVMRDFSPSQRTKVLNLISENRTDDKSPGVMRVRLAILKISHTIEEIETNVAVARDDFRDVLMTAESPKISELDFSSPSQFSSAELNVRYKQDKEQYLTWLRKP